MEQGLCYNFEVFRSDAQFTWKRQRSQITVVLLAFKEDTELKPLKEGRCITSMHQNSKKGVTRIQFMEVNIEFQFSDFRKSIHAGNTARHSHVNKNSFIEPITFEMNEYSTISELITIMYSAMLIYPCSRGHWPRPKQKRLMLTFII